MMMNHPLKFRDPELEKEYFKITDNISSKFYIVTFAMLILTAVCIALINFRVGKYVFGSTLFLVATIILFILWKRNSCKKVLPIFAFFIAEGLFITGLIVFKTYMNIMEITSIFFEGYAFGMFALLLQQLFPRFKIKMLIMAGSMIFRYVIVIPDTYIGWLICVPFDFANIIITFYNEKTSQSIFTAFFDYRNELSKFKKLLNKHFPENIAILKKDLSDTVFLNDPFSVNFKVDNVSQLLDLFSSLKVNIGTFNQDKALGSTSTFLLLESQTLSDFLKCCVEDVIRYRQIVFFNVEGVDTQGNKLSYGVKVFHLTWDDSDTIVIMLNDLTQQETILALKLADENKDKVLATVSHELRTPINGMLGITNIIEQEFSDPKLLGYCRTAKICSKMLLNLVNSILDLSQIRNNCIKINPTPFNLEELLEEIESIFRPQCASKEIEFHVGLDHNVDPKIVNDYNRLTQVIINLLANAIKFTFKGEISLTVSKGRNSNEVQFIIQDTGTGIKPEDRPKLFKMFGRLDQENSRINTQGVGLGLTISNSLVKLLNPKKENANIDFESIYEKGTTFFFTISTKLAEDIALKEIYDAPPSKTERATHYTKEHSACYSESMAEFTSGECSSRYALITSPRLPTSPRLGTSPHLVTSTEEIYLGSKYKSHDRRYRTRNPAFIFTSPVKKQSQDNTNYELKTTRESSNSSGSVLLVDDNSLNLIVVSALMKKRGFHIVTAFNGRDAIEKVLAQDRGNFFKMILMDCQMPVMDGYEATSLIREMIKKGEIPDVPVFALTANDTKKDQEKCLEAGMLAYLSKPLKEAELQKAMDEFVR